MSVANVHLSCDRTHERSLHPENTHLRDGRLCTRLSLLTLVVSSRSFCATARLLELNTRAQDGTTPLILAVLSAEGIVEQMVMS